MLYKPKFKSFLTLPTESAQAMADVISDAIGGGGSFKKTAAAELFAVAVNAEL